MNRPAVFSLAVFSLAGCASPSVPLSIGFPSDEAFLVTNAIDVLVVPLGEGELGRCPDLLGDAIQGTDIPTSSESLGLLPCDVLHGTNLPDPGPGARAFIVLGRATNGVILGGCAVDEAYPGNPAIEVELYPTNTMDYTAAVMTVRPAPGATAAARCNMGTP